MKPGYKQTEVGVIPAEWDVKTFLEIGTLTKGKGLLKENIKRSGSIPAIPYTALYTDFSEVLNYGHIKWFIDDETQSIIVREPCLLLASSSNMEANTGKASALVGTTPVAIGREVIVFKTSSDCKFLSYLLSTSFYRRKTLTLARGTTIKHVYPATFQNYQVAHPSLPEQRAIAEALSDVDALLGSLDRLIAKKRDLKQAAMQQILTGQTRLPGFHGEWVRLNMADHSTLRARIGWQGLTTAEYLETGDYYLVTGTDFCNGRIAWSTCHFVAAERYTQDRNIQLFPKDILLTKDGTIGKVAFVDELPAPATLNSGVFVIRPKYEAYDPTFFYYVLSSRIFDEFLTKLQAGSTISHLYQKDFVGFSFLAPPSISEQTAIAEVLSDMDAELSALEQRRDKTLALKQGMMQELLTGRTRLVS